MKQGQHRGKKFASWGFVLLLSFPYLLLLAFFGFQGNRVTPAEIVEQHRKGLILRLLSRNPLLNFRPPQKQDRGWGVGARIDVCSLFGGRDGLFDGHISDNEPGQSEENSANNPKEFLSKIIKSDKDNPVRIDLSSNKKYLAPLRRLQSNAWDAYRATGRWDLALAWPLLHMPRDTAKTPYCAPLLFWKIGVTIQGESMAKFYLYEDGVEFNFMLKEYLESERNIKLRWENDDNQATDLDALANRIREIFQEAKWEECRISDSFGKDNFVSEYNQDEGVAITPCAVIGKAGFSYRPLLEELNKLKKNLEKNPEGLKGLLRELLIPPRPNGVAESSRVDEPKPRDRWLVTDDSDATQEASVWQARQEKIMLINGPPGTGKSQTIVNLIADAVQRGERVVLACQKKPALDVVRKRLGNGDYNLADIVVQVDEPRQNRDAIIKKVRLIGATNDESAFDPLFDRDDLCERIAQRESECKLPDNNIPGRVISYSIRGDLRAKISRVTKKTNFDPFITASESFVSDIKKNIKKPIDQKESNLWKSRMKELADEWRDCGYMNNPWRFIGKKWDTSEIPRVHNECEELEKLFRRIATRRDSLPARAFLRFAESPLMTDYFHVFFDDERRETAHLLCQLISGTRQLFLKSARAKEVWPLWEKLFRDDTDDNPYTDYRLNCRNIPTIQRVHRKLEEHNALNIVTDKYPDEDGNWEDILLAVISKLRLVEMPFNQSDYEYAVNCLKDDISQKREADKYAILTQFSGRRKYAQELRTNNLLRLRAGARGASTPLRRLYHKGDDSIWKIYPVLLANPDTLCQILPNKPESIDTVIIDEASQMFTADALPIFYRAKKIIISGDNMQMPPADFFSVASSDDMDETEDKDDMDDTDDIDETDDKDGVLPRALNSGGVAPAQDLFELLDVAEQLLAARGDAARCRLGVHYRSRPIELIAFSNHAFYDGELQTAPYNDMPPACMQRPIEVEEIDGKFKNGINEKEISEVINKLHVILDNSPLASVGVIVFNTTQASKLKDAISKECASDADFKKKYDNAGGADEDTAFFVRSVENVQGDERDIIILATTYGSERRNFGPISKQKGRRRLNVAITRAKRGMFVITSLGNYVSNPGERPNDGGMGKERWYLWMYMRYARAVSSGNDEEAKAILKEINPDYQPRATGRDPDSEFEIDVAKFLRGEGYHVDYQIGESGFLIDLGIKKKGDTRYLCGVECDGRSFHSNWRARHNDIWRQGILEDKGWKIVRIWSDEWYNVSEAERGKELLDKIRAVEQKLMQKMDIK